MNCRTRSSALIDAGRLILTAKRIDGAVLDLKFRGRWRFRWPTPVIAKQEPAVFATGDDGTSIPKRYAHIAQCQKPVDVSKVVGALARMGET